MTRVLAENDPDDDSAYPAEASLGKIVAVAFTVSEGDSTTLELSALCSVLCSAVERGADTEGRLSTDALRDA